MTQQTTAQRFCMYARAIDDSIIYREYVGLEYWSSKASECLMILLSYIDDCEDLYIEE